MVVILTFANFAKYQKKTFALLRNWKTRISAHCMYLLQYFLGKVEPKNHLNPVEVEYHWPIFVGQPLQDGEPPNYRHLNWAPAQHIRNYYCCCNNRNHIPHHWHIGQIGDSQLNYGKHRNNLCYSDLGNLSSLMKLKIGALLHHKNIDNLHLLKNKNYE